MTIGGLAQAAGVGIETIRFYQRRGLLPAPVRPYGSVRRYGTADLRRLRFVRRSQELGFSLDQVAELLQLQDGTHCDEARALAQFKLHEVRRRLDDLQAMADALTDLVTKCGAAEGQVKCPLIDSLQVAAAAEVAGRERFVPPVGSRGAARRRRPG